MTPTTKAGRAMLARYYRTDPEHHTVGIEYREGRERFISDVLAIEREAAAEAEALRAALEGLVRKMAPHSGSCCTFDDDGKVHVTRESCKCSPVERAAHEAIDWYGKTWKRGTRPTGSGATPAPAAPSEPGCSTCHGQDETCRECGGAPAPADPEPRP